MNAMKKAFIVSTIILAIAISNGTASTALEIFNSPAKAQVTYDNASGAYPVITAILSQPGMLDGYTYNNWSFIVEDSTGAIVMFGPLPSGSSYVPTVSDAISVSGTYSPYNQIPEINPMTSITMISSGHPVSEPGIHTIPEISGDPIPQNLAGHLLELTNVTLYTDSGAMNPASGNFPTHANLPLYAKDQDGNILEIYVWASSYSVCGALGGTPIPTGRVNIVGILNKSGTFPVEMVPFQFIPQGPQVDFTNILTDLVRPGDAPTNSTFTEYALRPGETLTINARAYDIDGGNVTIQPSTTAPSGNWSTPNGTAGTNVLATFSFTPSPSDAGNTYTVTLQASLGQGVNTTTWSIYVPTAEEQNIVISEFLANPTTDTNSLYFNPLHRPEPGSTNAFADDEFIEVVNANGAPFDFIGWSLYDAASFRHQFYNSTSIGSSNSVVLFGGRLNADPAPPSIPGISLPFSEAQTGVSVLNDGGDSIRLYNYTGNLVTRIVYTRATADNGISWTRFPTLTNDFVEHTSVVCTNVSAGLQPDQRAYNLPVIFSEPPTISDLADQIIPQDTSAGPVSFTIGDPATPANDLTLFGNSSNPALVPSGNIAFGGSGSNRTVTVTPAAGQSGLAYITLTVGNANLRCASTNFLLTVTSTNSGVSLFCEDFPYADGSIITNSGFTWTNHNGTVGQMQVSGGKLQLTSAQSEDVNQLIPGQPYDSSSNLTLYAGFTVNFSALPTGDYFAHFKDSGFGYAARLSAGTDNAGSGQFRLSIANGTGTPVEFPQDLSLNTAYGVVFSYSPVSGQSRLWVNPANEASASVQDLSSPSPIVVTSFAFRQSSNPGIGSLEVDDLCTGTGFSAVVPEVISPAIALDAVQEGNDLILTWTNPAFTLLTGTNVTGITNPVSGATSPYTNSVVDPTRYFRLIMQ